MHILKFLSFDMPTTHSHIIIFFSIIEKLFHKNYNQNPHIIYCAFSIIRCRNSGLTHGHNYYTSKSSFQSTQSINIWNNVHFFFLIHCFLVSNVHILIYMKNDLKKNIYSARANNGNKFTSKKIINYRLDETPLTRMHFMSVKMTRSTQKRVKRTKV